MNTSRGTRMDRAVQKRLNNWFITIESSEDRHKQIIRSTVAKRAYQICEKRGCKHGFDLEDWVSAEEIRPNFTFFLSAREIRR